VARDHAFAISQPGPSALITVPFDLVAGYGSGVIGFDPSVPVHDDHLFLTKVGALVDLSKADLRQSIDGAFPIAC
jgi:hypothetical protein